MTTFPEAIASKGASPKSSSREVATSPRHVAYSSRNLGSGISPRNSTFAGGFSDRMSRSAGPPNPALRHEPADARKRCQEGIMEIIKDADGSVAVPEVRSESRGGKDGPVAGEHVHVMVRDGRGREGPCLSVLSQRRSRRDAGDFMDSDSGHSRSGRERRIEVSHVEVGIERGGQGQRDSFPTADEAQMVVEDGDPHRPADAVVAHKRTRLNRSS